MSEKVFLGETRPDAISRVQELLGPATTRPVAEKTFWALAKKGQITMDQRTGAYLMESEIEQPELRQEAEHTSTIQSRPNQPGQHYSISRHNFRRARIAWMWKARQASVFSPTLASAGVDLNDDSKNDDE